ncbi:hypothetical protein F4803DRAFT_545682 [Xylaria telfairii]|nr:hypothetical protein F4803DRAFT_545682 [Xylaria telfairii]
MPLKTIGIFRVYKTCTNLGGFCTKVVVAPTDVGVRGLWLIRIVRDPESQSPTSDQWNTAKTMTMTNALLVENIAKGSEYMCLELTEHPRDDTVALIGAPHEFASAVEARRRRGNGSNGDDRIEHHVTRMVAIPSPLKSANSRQSGARIYEQGRKGYTVSDSFSALWKLTLVTL